MKSQEIIDRFENAGYTIHYNSTSVTDWGESSYYTVSGGYIRGEWKMRVSDHTVTNIARIQNEIHYGFENWEKVLFPFNYVREFQGMRTIKGKIIATWITKQVRSN